MSLAGSDDMRSLDPKANTVRVSFGARADQTRFGRRRKGIVARPARRSGPRGAGVPIRLTGSEQVVEVLSLVRQKIIELNEASGGKGAKNGTEDSHVAKGGNPTKRAGLKAWLPDA